MGDQLKVGRTILKFIVGDDKEAQYHEEIYRLMTTDGLTQLHNKRYFDEMLDREVARAKRYKRTFSLLVFDIDHFKKVNDRFGHLGGDAILRQLGAVLLGRLRVNDVLARIGGEEFALITPEVGLDGATELAGKINRLIRRHTLRVRRHSCRSHGERWSGRMAGTLRRPCRAIQGRRR